MSVTTIGVFGATGRMGQRVLACAATDPSLKISAAYERPTHSAIGKDVGEIAGLGAIGVPLAGEIGTPPDVIIDFSTPESSVELSKVCAERGLRLVLATTGFSAEQREVISQAAKKTAILWAPSMSLAVNVAMKLVADAGRALKDVSSGVDVEIIERHHRFKEDAPSGTALKFGEIVAQGMGQTEHVHGREGRIGQRPRNEIGYHALRTGDNVGEHTIVFGLMGETLEVTVRGNSRDSYAQGALTAAKFLAGRPAGLYSMADALGLNA